jgi:hypothetical protein
MACHNTATQGKTKTEIEIHAVMKFIRNIENKGKTSGSKWYR